MAKKPIQADESFADLAFPLRGVDLSAAFGEQVPGTTPVGLNVRAFEPSTLRGRGGSRPGFVEYLPQLPNGAHLIQHLNYVVDPDGSATLDIDDGSFLDPSSPGPPESWGPWFTTRNAGRRIRSGGHGRMHIKNRRALVTVTANNQSKQQGTTFTFTGTEFTASGLVGSDSIAFVVLKSAGAPAGAPNGAYAIVPSAAVFTAHANRYTVRYQNGTMTVGSTFVSGTRYEFFDGDRTWTVIVCPPATLPDVDPCSGNNDGATFEQEIANGWLQNSSPIMGAPGITCGLG